MNEQFYQGSKDVFLTGVRADFNAVENQAVKSITSLEQNGLLKSDINTDGLFTEINSVGIAVWRHVSTTGLDTMGLRKAGGQYPAGKFVRGFETTVMDPDIQDSSEIMVPEERQGAEASQYKEALNRAQKLVLAARRKNIGDPFDMLNMAFIAPSTYVSAKFSAKGNQGLDGNLQALNEKLITTSHKIALTNAAPSAGGSNLIANGSNYAPFNADYYYAALEQATTLVDDVGQPMPMFGGQVTLVLPSANGMVRTAQEINKSEWKTLSANNEVNVLQGAFTKIVSSPFLLNSVNYSAGNAQNLKWFMIDTSSQDPQVGTGLLRITFVPTNSRVERREELDSIAYKLKQSYSYAFVDWRNIMGSLGTGAY